MPHAVHGQQGTKRPASEDPHPMEAPVKRQTKWSEEENDLIIDLRGSGMKWEDVSRHLPGRSAISCRLHYQNFLEKRPEWDEEKRNRLARLYERFRKEMWERVAKELKMPWRAAEEMHWLMGKDELAQRAGATPFRGVSAASTSVIPMAPTSVPGIPITTSFAPANSFAQQPRYGSSVHVGTQSHLTPRFMNPAETISGGPTPTTYSAPPPAHGHYFPPPMQGQGSYTFRQELPRSAFDPTAQQQQHLRPSGTQAYSSPSQYSPRTSARHIVSQTASPRAPHTRRRSQTSVRMDSPSPRPNPSRAISSSTSHRSSMPALPPTALSGTGLDPVGPPIPPLPSLPPQYYSPSREGEGQRLPPMRLAGEGQLDPRSEQGSGLRPPVSDVGQERGGEGDILMSQITMGSNEASGQQSNG
ncbi:MAG: hypothetical protein M1828_007532 [Chrysothrix sp. TS-e1954]|nr:MAG: hypothetical protein M1828_007532 [Chrysothrix sp. TS-e1954]